MNKYYLLQNNTIVNIIEAEPSFIATIQNQYQEIIPQDEIFGGYHQIGYVKNGSTFVPPNSTEPPEVVLEKRIRAAMVFGDNLIVEIAKENIMLGYTPTQIRLFVEKTSNLILLLKTGALYTALEDLNNITFDEVITEPRIIKIKNQIQQFLGLI